MFFSKFRFLILGKNKRVPPFVSGIFGVRDFRSTEFGVRDFRSTGFRSTGFSEYGISEYGVRTPKITKSEKKVKIDNFFSKDAYK